MGSYQKYGCSTCGTFPYIDHTGMCATCTFGEADAQQELISGEMEGAVWEREKVNDVCPVKLSDRDKAINALKKLGVSFKECNNGMQLNIKTHAGLVMYWPTTRKVNHNKMTRTLFWINSDSSGDIIDLVKKLGFDKKSEVTQ